MNFSNFFIILFIILLFFPCIFISFAYSDELNITKNDSNLSIILSEHGFAWPIPGYTKITSPFGKRTSPTAGASSFHKGLDIGAPEGTSLVAVNDGKISYIGFLGGGGYTITLSFDDFKITYCHVSPNFVVSVGDTIKQGEIIGHVGPKYVYGVPGNTYKDSSGRPTNGATTGCHLHLGFRINNEYVDPMDYF